MVRRIVRKAEAGLPATQIQPVNGTLTWLLDRKAAALLDDKEGKK